MGKVEIVLKGKVGNKSEGACDGILLARIMERSYLGGVGQLRFWLFGSFLLSQEYNKLSSYCFLMETCKTIRIWPWVHPVVDKFPYPVLAELQHVPQTFKDIECVVSGSFKS